ncbi:hypothetical protein D3C71_1940700 [compost metagenome]
MACGQPWPVQIQRFAGDVGAQPGIACGRDQHRRRLQAAVAIAVARVDQVAMAATVAQHMALVVAGGADRLAVVQRQRRHRLVAARVADADLPRGAVGFLPQRHDIAANIKQR